MFEGTPRLVQIRSERVPQSVLREITAGIGVKIGDPITEDTVKHIREVVSAIDEHLRVTLQSDERGGVVLAIIAP